MMRIFSKTSLCSTLAIATAMMVGARPAAAQVAGNVNSAGGATITNGGKDIQLNATQTTIDWTATGTVTGGVNDFLPNGNQMNFTSSSDFAVLNRVTTSGSDMLGLNGTITSTVGDVKGGTVFFYNPNGIVVGGSAVIDVGSLGLTTSDPGSGNNWFADFGGGAPTLSFGGVTNSASKVQIDSGAQISSNGTNNFIAIVAPKVSSSGTIKADGDVALVAAEAATLRFNDSSDLYAIEVSIGTDTTSNSIELRGGSIGRNSEVETAGTARHAYLVAVPKNTATTMLIANGASLGFDVADSVVVEGNSIVLSAGRDLALFGGIGGDGSIRIEDATFSSALDAFATTQIMVNPTDGAAQFFKNVEFTAGDLIALDAFTNDIRFDGNLLADVSRSGLPGQDTTAGTIALSADAGNSIEVAGSATFDATALGGNALDGSGNGFAGTGGSIVLAANGGSMQFANAQFLATGNGGRVDGNATGGTGTGGTITATIANGGAISANTLTLRANGEGGTSTECSFCGVTGGTGQGGTITLDISGASSLTAPTLFIEAIGNGGAADNGGFGSGGTIDIDVAGGSSITATSLAWAFADSLGGESVSNGNGGDAHGGTSTLDAVDSTLTFGQLYVTADGMGGDAAASGQFAGSGEGGSATVTTSGTNLSGNVVLVGASGFGGTAVAGLSGSGAGGIGTLDMTGGQLAFGGGVNVLADGTGEDGAAGGSANAGTANFWLDGTSQTGGQTLVGARATGGIGSAGAGGNASGGHVDVSIANANVNAGAMTLTGNSTAGAGADGGGIADGTAVDLSVSNSTLVVNGILALDGKAVGGAATADGAGGAAGGADVTAMLDNSSVTTTGRIDISSEATGGASLGAFNGGNGTGGNASLNATGGSTVSTNNTWVIAYGTGGAANCLACDAAGGDGQGGAAAMTLTGAGTTFGVTNTLQVYSSGIGGDGTGDAGGGDGSAATATLQVGGGTTLNVKNGFVFADGIGGDGQGIGNGGDAHASTASLIGDAVAGGTINHSTTSALSPFHVTAEAFGGAADIGNGGSAFAGTAIVNGNGLHFTSTNSGMRVSAYGQAGNSVSGAGGNATGGWADVDFLNGSVVNLGADLVLNSYAQAGNGEVGGNAVSHDSYLLVDNSTLNTGIALAPEAYSVVLAAYALGGSGSDDNGGDATSGDTNLTVSNGGTLSAQSLQVSTNASGGNSADGTKAGDADAGFSVVKAESGGSLTVAGQAKILASATGGVGTNGADGGNASADALALLHAVGTGSVSIGGDLEINTNRTGGAGYNGGDALAVIDYQTPEVGELYPVSEILSNGGSVTVGGFTTLTANGVGGAGESGGRGGDAFGGVVSVRAVNSAAAPSIVTLHDAALTATATAGDGGQGISPDGGDGGNGGDGGDALGGLLYLQAMSLDGQITTGDLTLSTTAQAGSGGDGGSGTNGGNGGLGGSVITNWSAGAINISSPNGGNPTGLPQVTNGFVHLGGITADTSATGGDGGWGGYAYDGLNGTAGNGGFAQSGDMYVINRGGDMAAGDVTWNFDANGGAAGRNANESLAGVGGSASTGELLLINSNRAGQTGERGTMTFGNFNGTGTSTGGSGLVDGRSLYTSNLDFETTNADGHFTSLTYTANASDGPAVDGYDLSSLISIANGTVQIDNGLSVTVPGDLAVWLDNGTLTATTVDLSAGNFIHRVGDAPVSLGLIDVGALSVSTGGDIIIDANLDISGGLGLSAPGSIAIGSATSHDGGITLTAGGGFVLTSALVSAGGVAIDALDDVTTKAITAAGSLDVTGANLTFDGALSAGDALTLTASGDIAAGDIGAHDMAITGASLIASDLVAASDGGISVVTANGISIDSADAGFDIALDAGGPVMVAGALTAGNNLTVFGDGISIDGTADAGGYLFLDSLANVGVGGGANAGSYVGIVAGGNVTLASANAFGNDLDIDAGGNVTITGAAISAHEIEIIGGGLVTTGNLSAQNSVIVEGQAIDVANVNAGADLGLSLVGEIDGDEPTQDIGLYSGSTILAGSLNAAGSVGLAAPGSITAGTINSGDLVLALGGGAMNFGPITAGGEAYFGSFAMFALGAGDGDFDPAPILAQAPAATGGSIAIAGNLSASQVRASAGNNWSSGAITASGGPVQINAGGALQAGNVSATGGVTLAATGGALAVGGVNGNGIALNAGGAVTATGALVSGAALQIGAGGNLSMTSGNAQGDIDLAAAGAIASTGPVAAGADLLVDATGNVTLQSASATNLAALTGNNIQVGNFSAATATVDAAGTLTVGGAWNAAYLDASSKDIAIGQAGSIDGNFAHLLSTSNVGAGIGNNSGAANGSYLLDNAELGRIGSSTVFVYAVENGSPIDLMIGATTLTGGERYYDFGVVDTSGGYSGRLRVTGQIVGQNFTDDDRLDLDAQLMEIDAVNGGIDFSPNSDATVGTLAFYGERVHVAEASVLDKLAANPDYAERDLDLATAPTASHSETVINVGTIDVDLFQTGQGQGGFASGAAVSPYTIYVQNMGSSNVRSGLLIADANLYGDISPGSVDMILNGKLFDVESGQTLQGAAVRDAFVADPENDLTLFTASSSINGCGLSGGGCFTPEPPAPPPTPQVEDLANQFVFLDNSVGDQLGFGDDSDSAAGDADSDSDDEDADKSEEKTAIDPPPSLINGKPLDPQTPTDEPVSGSGNPALIGAGSNQQEQQ